jgi:hypothetical protein
MSFDSRTVVRELLIFLGCVVFGMLFIILILILFVLIENPNRFKEVGILGFFHAFYDYGMWTVVCTLYLIFQLIRLFVWSSVKIFKK